MLSMSGNEPTEYTQVPEYKLSDEEKDRLQQAASETLHIRVLTDFVEKQFDKTKKDYLKINDTIDGAYFADMRFYKSNMLNILYRVELEAYDKFELLIKELSKKYTK